MDTAMFIESWGKQLNDRARQILIVPVGDTTVLYSRLTNGEKGHGSKWEEISIDQLTHEIGSDEYITAEPVGVTVTDNDIEAIGDKGYSPVLTTKALSMHEKSKENIIAMDEDTETLKVFCSVYEEVVNRNPRLKDYIIDNRRNSGKKLSLPNSVQVVPQPTQTTQGSTTMHNEAPVIHAALASVPRQELADRYVHRKLPGDIEDFAVFDFARNHKRNVLIYGPTGPGKTTSIEAWAAHNKLRMVTVSGSAALEPGHLFGKFVSDGRGGFAWIDGPVTDVVRNGGVLNLDELNFISMKIITPIYSLLDNRRTITLLDHHGEVIEAHPDLTIFATMNPDYVGTSPLNAAFRNRFDIQIPWGYDEKVESKLIKSKNLLKLANQLRKEADKGSYDTPIATNMLMEFEEIVNDLNYEFAVENFIAHFAPEEQSSVRLVLQTNEFNLKSDMGIKVESPVDDTPEPLSADKMLTIEI